MLRTLLSFSMQAIVKASKSPSTKALKPLMLPGAQVAKRSYARAC